MSPLGIPDYSGNQFGWMVSVVMSHFRSLCSPHEPFLFLTSRTNLGIPLKDTHSVGRFLSGSFSFPIVFHLSHKIAEEDGGHRAAAAVVQGRGAGPGQRAGSAGDLGDEAGGSFSFWRNCTCFFSQPGARNLRGHVTMACG